MPIRRRPHLIYHISRFLTRDRLWITNFLSLHAGHLRIYPGPRAANPG